MTAFTLTVLSVLAVSAVCSLSEAALYSVRLPYVRRLAESGSGAGVLLASFKRNMEQPISAILILNTAANTAGAAIAGAQARILFGEAALVWFSAGFTAAILFLSEIVPKVLGVVYNQGISRSIARPLSIVIQALRPLIWLIHHITKLLKPSGPVLSAPEEEVRHMAMISAEEGSILRYEAELVKNVLRLDEVRAHDIMTPRPVVMKLAANMTLREVAAKVKAWTHTRIPIYDADDPEVWVGMVLSRDILTRLANDDFQVTLDSLKKPLHFVTEKARGHVLLKAFLKRRTHLFGVVDEYGSVTGIVTLEDVLESLIGEEIVDEVDTAVDMQEVAKLRRQRHLGDSETHSDSNVPDGG